MRARTDEELLAATPREPGAFAELYRRHATAFTAYFLRRTRDVEAAADLTAETFAAALQRARRFDPQRGTAAMWLFGIAHRELATYFERGAVAQRARRRMRIPRIDLDDEALERVLEVAAAAETGRRLTELLEQPYTLVPAGTREVTLGGAPMEIEGSFAHLRTAETPGRMQLHP